jgi:hypothetical protein
MITPEKPSSHTASQAPTTDNSPDSEFKTDSQAGIVPATENVADVMGTLDPSSVSQLRQFFELLDQLDRQHARVACAGQKLERSDQTLREQKSLQSGATLSLKVPVVDGEAAA